MIEIKKNGKYAFSKMVHILDRILREKCIIKS